MKMRRSDREVVDAKIICEIIDSCEVMRLGMVDGNIPYVLPLNFGYCYDESNGYTFYFHAAKVGRKTDILKANNNVCVELDIGGEVVETEIACDYGYSYTGIVANGKAVLLSDKDEKVKGLDLLMKQMTKQDGFTYSDKMIERTAVYRIDIENLSCKKYVEGE